MHCLVVEAKWQHRRLGCQNRVKLGPYGPFSIQRARDSHAFEFERALGRLNNDLKLEGEARIQADWYGGEFDESELQPPCDIEEMIEVLRNAYMDQLLRAAVD
jgi:hypothetical protein